MDKYKFIEDMLNERYEEHDIIDLRRCHIEYAICSLNFRNENGNYFWHKDKERKTKAKLINAI